LYGASELAGAVNTVFTSMVTIYVKTWFTSPTSSGEQTDASQPTFNLDITIDILSLKSQPLCQTRSGQILLAWALGAGAAVQQMV